MGKNDKKKEAEIFYDLESWLKSAIGQNALKHDNLNTIRELGHGKEADTGKAIHSLEKGLREVTAWAQNNYNLYPEIKSLPGNKGARIVYKPRGAAAKDIQDSDCPFIEIARTGQDGSYTIRDGILSPNSPILVRGSNGEVGLASVMSTEIAQILDDWKDNDMRIRQQLSKNKAEGLKYLKRLTSRSAASVKQLTAGVYSTHQIKEYTELNDKSVNNLRPEALWAMMSQVLTGHYTRQLYNANSTKRGAPTLQQFQRDIDNIMDASRGLKTAQQVSNYVKQHYGWIYQNVWKGDFENVFNSFAGKMSQSGMTEGTKGKFGLMEVEAALKAFQAPGKKLKQNAQVLPQKTSFLHGKALAATGMTSVMSKKQLAKIKQGIKNGFMSNNDIFKDVYTTAMFSKQDLENAKKELKRLYSARGTKTGANEILERYGLSVKQFEKQYDKSVDMMLKGFGADASFMGVDLARDLRGVRDPKHLKDGFITFDELNNYVRDSILESKQRKLERLKKDPHGKNTAQKIDQINKEIAEFSKDGINVLEKEASGKFKYGQYGVFDKLQNYVRKIYDLDNTYKINNNFKFQDGLLTNLVATRARHNNTAVFRAGLTADERTTKSMMSNLLMAESMYQAKYRPEDIFRDATQKLNNGGGLKAQNFIESAPLSNKNIRSRIMQVLTHVNTELRDQRKMQGEDVAKFFKEDEFFGKFFKEKGKNAIFSIDKETGMLLIDNDALEARLDAKHKSDAEMATNMLFAAVRVGQAAGVYDPNVEYFKKRRGAGTTWITQEAPILLKEELGLSSSPEWMNLGRAGSTRSRIGINELRSLEATEGEFGQWLLDQGYTVGNKDKNKDYDVAIAPIRNYLNAVRDKMEDNKAKYYKYVENADYLAKNFSTEASQFRQDILDDMSVVKLDVNDLASMDLDMKYDAIDKGGMLIENGDLQTSNLVGPYLARKRKERFEQIQALKEDPEQWNKLSALEKSKYNAINSEDDLKMFALDFGNERLSTEINGKIYDSRMMVLPIGSFDKDRPNIYKPDEGLKTATSMLQSAKQFLIHDGSFDRDKQAYFTTKNIIENLKDWQKEITGGKTFEEAHEVTGGKGSGYLLLQGMTDNSEEILKDILGSRGDGSNLKNVSRIVSTTDLTEMFKAEFQEDESKVIDLYQSIFKKGPGEKSRDEIIKAIVDSVDISKKGKDGKRTWKGNILNNLWSNRNPTINFINDLIGGGLVASSNTDLVDQGRMLINKHYAAIGKGDMDGDLVTLFDALNNGDFQTAGSALSSFFTHKREYQKEIQEEEAKEDAKNLEAIKRNILRNNPQADVSNIMNAGDIKKTNSVLDKEEKDITVAAAWLGKQGAGRYGNAKFSAEDIISSVVGTEGRQGNNITAFGARVFGAIIHSLYQKGINIKNLKRGSNGEESSEDEENSLDKEAGKVYDQMLSTMEMVTGAGTWDNDDIRRSFFDRAEALGVFKNEAMFEGATLQTLGLDNITKNDKKFLSDLRSVAENAKIKLEHEFGPNSAQVKTIEADIKQIKKVQSGKQKTITNLSKEFVNAIVGGDYSQSFASTVGRDGKSLGYQMSRTFEHIEGYSSSISNLIPVLGEVVGKGQYDEETLHKFANFFATAQNNKQSNYTNELRLLEKYKDKYKDKNGIYTSPSSELKQFFVNDKEYIQSDDKIGKLAAKYVSATTDEEREKIQREVNALTPEFRESSGAVDTIRGLIAHKVAEVLALKENKDMDISSWQTGREALNLLDDKFINPYKAQLEFMSDTFKDPKTMEKFLLNAAQKGVGNTRLLRSTMQRTAGSGKAISLGSETPLLGYSAVNEQGYHKKSYQTADTMWVTEDENGLVTLHVGDFKNPKKDHISIQNIMQLADEARSMEILSEHVQELQRRHGTSILDADFFFSYDTAIGRDWQKRLEYAAAKESGQTDGVEYRQAYQKLLKDFNTKLRYASSGFARTQGHLITSNNAGYSSVYDVRLADPKLRQMFGDYLNPSKGLDNVVAYNSEDANAVVNSATTRVSTSYTGTFEEAKSQLSEDAQKILKRYEDLQTVRADLTDLEIKEQALRREISTPEREVAIEELKKQINDKRTEYAEGLNSIQEDAKVLGGRAIYNDQGLQIEGVGKEAVLDPLNALITATDNFYERNKHKAKQADYLESLVKHLREFEIQAKRVADLEAKVKSPLLKGKNKRAARADARAELEQETTNLEKLITSIEEERGGLDKKEGQFINPYTLKTFDEETSKALGLNRDIDKIYSKARKRAKQDRRVSDRGQIAAYEAAVSSYHRQQYQFEDEIAAKEEELTEAENEGLEKKVELLQLQIEQLKELKELTLTSAKNDLDAMYGANPESYKKQTRIDELNRELQKNDKKPKAPQQQGGGGGGFMGIDSATSRWFERLANGGIIFTAIRLIRRGFNDLTNKAKQLDQAMTNLRIVTGKSADDARILIDNYAELGKELGATTVEVTAAATSWLRQGYDISQVNDLVTSSLYLSKLGMIDVATATQNMTSAMHGFQLEASQAMDIVDKLTALDVKAATTAGDIAQGLSQFANIARLGGVSIDQAAAYVATIADVNQMSGITVGQSLKTIMSRYGNVKAGAYNKLDVTNESNDTGEKLNDVERVLTKMGISIRKTNLEFKDFDEVLDEIAKKWGTLDNVSKRAIANAFAGVRQQEAFMILLENYDKYQDLLEVSENSKGTAERKYQSYKESFAFARNEFTAALEQFANSSMLSKLLTDLTKVGTDMLSWFQKYGKFIPNIIMEMMRLRIVMGKGLFNQGYETIMRRNLQGGGMSFSRWFRGSGKGAQSVQAEGGSAPNAAPNKTMGSKAGTALAFAELGANILTTSLTQLKTAATTHQYNGETVESSTNAQKQGGAVSAAVSLIPFLGTFLGPLAGEAWASNVDKQRDIANAMTSGANRRLTKLRGLTSSLNAIGASEQGSAERHKLVQEFRREIFDKDNVELRKILSRHLGNQSITTLLEQIDSNTAESSEALKTIQLAQIQAEKTQIYNKYASALFEDQKEINKIVAKLDHVNSYDAGMGTAIVGGATAAGGATGVLAGAGIGASIGAAGGPIGAAGGALIGLIVGVISGLIGGSVANTVYQEAQADITKEAYQKLDWSAQNSIERIDTTKENIKATQDKIDELENGYDDLREQAIQELMRTNGWDRSLAIDELNFRSERSGLPNAMNNLGGNSGLSGGVESFLSAYTDLADARKDLENYEKLLEALERQTTVEMQILNEMNDLTLQESLVASYITNGATGSKSYLSDMTISQLKNLGVDEILTVYGQAIEEAGGLHGMDVWTDASKTQLSEAGYDYLFEELRKQGDEEINAVLSGAAFTLEEALNLKGKGGYEVQRRLQAFADSLGVSVDALDQVVDKFGKLTLAETMLSPEEIITQVENLSGLLTSITSGAGSMSSWMQNIITQFPELIAYMGDIPTLFAEATERMDEFSNVFLKAQYDAIMSSEALFKSVQDELFNSITDDAAAALRENPALTKLSDIMTWVTGQYDSNGNLSEEAKNVVKAVQDIADEYGMKVVSNVLKNYYDQLITFRVKTIDTELSNLESQKTALGEIVHQREYENKLIEAKLKLEDASKQKKRIYRAGVGWVYESDQSAISSAQKDLDSLSTEKQISQIESRMLALQGYKEELNNVYENQNYETLQQLYEEAVADNKVASETNSFISDIKTSVNGISKDLSEYIAGQLALNKENKDKAVKGVEDAWKAFNKSAPGTSAYNMNLQALHKAMTTAINNGATKEDFKDFAEYESGNNPASRISAGQSVWDIATGDINSQETKVKTQFDVVDPRNETQRFVGFTNGDMISTQVANWIFDGLKDGNAIIWTDASTGFQVKNGSFQYAVTDSDTDLYSYFKRVSDTTGQKRFLVSDPDGKNESIFYDNGQIYKVVNNSGKKGFINGMQVLKDQGGHQNLFDAPIEAAWGSMGFPRNSLGLINELGTEAIITPQGTLTALPSRTGIVPADITKNLWELGDVAPTLVRMLEGKIPSGVIGKSIFGDTLSDESFNVSNLVMNVTADSSFDVDKFVETIKTRVSLTKNNSK